MVSIKMKLLIILVNFIILTGVLGCVIWARLDGDVFYLIMQQVDLHRDDALYIFIFLYIVSAPLLLPTFYLTILAGVFFGPFVGAFLDLCGNTLGSLLAFVISRYLYSQKIESVLQQKNIKLLKSHKIDWKLNALLRSS
jgi:uncharacterized membrane protein YdjX (TVP38/TMEM64 family)